MFRKGVPLTKVLILAFGILGGLVPWCNSFLVPSGPRSCYSRASSALCQSQISEDPSADNTLSLSRRQIIGVFLSPLLPLPVSALSTETEIAPDLNALSDLPPIPKDCVRLYLCRHGQTENNRLRKVQGARVDPPINDNGYAQATNLGKALLNANPCPLTFFSSNLQRAKMTAGTAAGQIDTTIQPTQLASLAEIDFGPGAEGQPIALAQAGMQATYTAWAMGKIDFLPNGGGDSGRDVLNRAAESLKVLAQEAQATPNGCVAAVTHSAFLRVLIGMVLDEALVESASRKVVNGGVTIIDIPKDLKTRRLGRKPKLLGGLLSQAPSDFDLEIPICTVVRINEARHLPEI